MQEPFDQARSLELMRLDQLPKAIYPSAKDGDIAAIDRCLAISLRRARRMGLDLRPVAYSGEVEGPDNPRVIKVRSSATRSPSAFATSTNACAT